MYYAATRDRDEIVRLLVAAGAADDPDRIRLSEALILAACRGFALNPGEGYPSCPGAPRDPKPGPTIAEVLQQGADVNGTDPEGFTPLMYAANLGLLDNVKTLLDHGADATLKSARGDTAYSLAVDSQSMTQEMRGRILDLLRGRLEDKD